MKMYEIINEGRDAPLYHGTTLEKAVDIMKDGKLISFVDHAHAERDVVPTIASFCLTRDKNLWFGDDETGHGFIQFELDQAALIKRYKVNPVDYYNSDTFKKMHGDNEEDAKHYRANDDSESEERLYVKGGVLPLWPYLVRILIRKDIYGWINWLDKTWGNGGWQVTNNKQKLELVMKIAKQHGVPVYFVDAPQKYRYYDEDMESAA